MAINRNFFFDHARLGLFGGKMSSSQVSGITLILDKWEHEMPKADDRWLAYMFGTAHHETGRTMQPLRETFASTDAQAIKILDKAFATGKLPWVKERYWQLDPQGISWLGRGFVQLTHKANYLKMAALTDPNLATNPSLAMNTATAADIMFKGMDKGSFTGAKLGDFFSGAKEKWREARRIINGLERADLVAAYGKQYYACLSYTTG
ncbi:hypothetical protein NKJ35_27185 [Mesorhizobium sp. M0136]|uniref:hypothetical protein n=1 Tax=Mesorhizobium sp. M0136 TaxID=2956890 RepID=UPI0033381967